MITILQGKTQKVEISPEGPTVIIGEWLNPMGRSRLAEALRKGTGIAAHRISEAAAAPQPVASIAIRANPV